MWREMMASLLDTTIVVTLLMPLAHLIEAVNIAQVTARKDWQILFITQ